jgi:hypothetical protein
VVNETAREAGNPELQRAVLIVLFEYLPWLSITAYFFISKYSEVSFLDGFVFGFPAACLLVHFIAWILALAVAGPSKEKIAKYALQMNFFLALGSYVAFFIALLSNWNM